MTGSMEMVRIFTSIADPYERKARIAPALIVLMPVAISFAVAFQDKYGSLQVVVLILMICGGPLLLSNFVRFRGKQLEARLTKKWGALPTTILLRHSDSKLNPNIKATYHREMQKRFGFRIPSVEQERQNPMAADQIYEAGVSSLRETNRGEDPLVLKENISYGFVRNMCALRPFGVITALAGLVSGLIISSAITINPWSFQSSAILRMGLEGGILVASSSCLLVLWLVGFGPAKVERAAYVYAERLLSRLGRP